MTHTNYLIKPNDTTLLIKLMVIGAGFGLLLAALFIRSAGEGDPGWPQYWLIKPLIILPLAGATGGAFSYYLIQLTPKGGWKRILAIVLSLVIYLVGLWMGVVLGFHGTMWD